MRIKHQTSGGTGGSNGRAPAAIAAAFALSCALPSCGPLFEPAYGTSVSYATDCSGSICSSAALMRTVRRVQEGDIVDPGTVRSNAPYLGWVISRIGESGVVLRPSPDSEENVFIPYRAQDSTESRGGGPYYFASSLSFEKGALPGTAVMTVVEQL